MNGRAVKADLRRILGVLFDAGDTLIYDPDGGQETSRRILFDRGHSFPPVEISKAWDKARKHWENRYKALDPSWNDEIAFAFDVFVLRELGLRGNVEEEAQYMVENWADYANPVLYPDTEPCLAWVKGLSLKLGVVSNSQNETMLTQLLSKVGIAQHFDCIISSGTVGCEKPNPRIFEVASQRIGLDATSLVHVGDNYDADVLGAKAAGIMPVLIDRSGKHPGKDCTIVNSLLDLKKVLG